MLDDASASKMERYIGFLLTEWGKLAKAPLRDPKEPPISQSQVLDRTLDIVGNRPGLRLEFGVWQGKSINRCAKRFPDAQWFGFDSFEGFPDDGRIDWQKPFKVINLPDAPKNVTLVKGYFSDTLAPFLQDHTDDVAFVNIDCDIYSSTVDVFLALEAAQRLKPGVIIYFDELINYADFMWNEALALFEMCERTGLGVEWLHYDHRLRSPDETAELYLSGSHPTWNDDIRSGHWVQASCRITGTGIDLGPLDDPKFKKRIFRILAGMARQQERREQALADRNARLAEMERERERRYVARKKLEKERQRANLAARQKQKQMNRD
jgi:SAM-dependent methyltransferase